MNGRRSDEQISESEDGNEFACNHDRRSLFCGSTSTGAAKSSDQSQGRCQALSTDPVMVMAL
jgi:hypothetical protein